MELFEFLETIKQWSPLCGMIFGMTVFLLALFMTHPRYAAIGLSVMGFAAVVAIPYALDVLLWNFKGSVVPGPQRETIIGAFAALISSLCTVGNCFATAAKKPKP